MLIIRGTNPIVSEDKKLFLESVRVHLSSLQVAFGFEVGEDRKTFYRLHEVPRWLNIYISLDILWAVILFDRWENLKDRKQRFWTPRSLQEPLVYWRLLISPILITWRGLHSAEGWGAVCVYIWICRLWNSGCPVARCLPTRGRLSAAI